MTSKKRGPAKPGPGRPKGSRNKATILRENEQMIVEDIMAKATDCAMGYSVQMIENLARIALDPEVAMGVRVSASNAVLDRSIGRPIQQQTLTVKGNVTLTGILESIAAKGVDLNSVD